MIVDANLIDAASGAEMWHGRYHRPNADELELEQEVSADLSRSLRDPSAEPRTTAERRSTTNKEAYRHYLQGLYEMRLLTADASDKAIANFEQAIALDPNFVVPYFGLASAYEVLFDWSLAPDVAVPKARKAIEKALDLDPSFAQAHTMLGTVNFWYDFDQTAAEKELRRGLELNPNFDDGHDFYGWFLVCHKRFEESVAEHRRAIELSPFDMQHRLIFSQTLYYVGRYDEAFEELRTTLLQNPNSWWGHELLGWVYEKKGDLPRSLAEMKRSVELEPRIAEPLASLGRVYALSGDRASALKVLDQLNRMKQATYVSPYPFAFLYVALNDRERAVAELRRAYEVHSWAVDYAGIDPKLESIRSDPRVQEILRKAGLP